MRTRSGGGGWPSSSQPDRPSGNPSAAREWSSCGGTVLEEHPGSGGSSREERRSGDAAVLEERRRSSGRHLRPPVGHADRERPRHARSAAGSASPPPRRNQIACCRGFMGVGFLDLRESVVEPWNFRSTGMRSAPAGKGRENRNRWSSHMAFDGDLHPPAASQRRCATQ